ncbi:MAG: ABC transporter ATP-binding protein/permease [Gammaproteobacteria bacterium]|nr:ABC transporter ATP-binding protein/permease [Gammaproteobacteria bacterium]
MIAYYICASAAVTRLLEDGIIRERGREYVFRDWDDIQLLLSAMVPKASVAEAANYVVLVLELHEDMVVASPIPLQRIPPGLRREECQGLQGRSMFLEVDVSPEHIVDVKDGLGNSVKLQFEPRTDQPAPIARLLAYMKPYWPYVAGATGAGLVKFLAPLAFPWILRVILDDVVLKEGLDNAGRYHLIWQLVLFMLVVNAVWMVACYYRSVLGAVAGHRMIRDLRVALFDHVQRLSHSFFARQQSGAIVSRVVNDLSLAQNFVGSALTNVWMDTALLVALIGLLFSIHPTLTLISIALLPIYVASLRALGSRIRLATLETQQRLDILAGGLQEKVAGMAVVKGFAREQHESSAFASQANKLLNRILSTVRFTALNETLIGLVVHMTPVLVVWYGTHQIISHALSVGQLTQFLLYLAMFYFPLQRLSELSVVLANALAAIERIFAYFDIQPQVIEQPGARELASCRGNIDFESVDFSYEPGNPVLRGVTFAIEEGETVAFVGPSGSGKSTLANLVPRFYDPTSGVVRVDSIDLRDLTLASLRNQIGIVSQETILFSGTVQENLILAKPGATSDEVLEALDAANATEFVEALSDGLGTELGERGIALSGGQRQRLAIARAFLRNPRILILDEATSALDSTAERRIQQALERLLQDRTSIVIAHRLSTIARADRIVVLDHGRVVEVGNHQQLLASEGLYASLYRDQFSAL